jgi:hypothetical protein
LIYAVSHNQLQTRTRGKFRAQRAEDTKEVHQNKQDRGMLQSIDVWGTKCDQVWAQRPSCFCSTAIRLQSMSTMTMTLQRTVSRPCSLGCGTQTTRRAAGCPLRPSCSDVTLVLCRKTEVAYVTRRGSKYNGIRLPRSLQAQTGNLCRIQL